jgi:carboxymethylenebutenolidase
MGTHLKLTASDGHKFGAYRVDPAGTPKGGIVVIQEIFGVNRHIRSVADRFAALGYVAIAPALFDRIEAGFECGYSPEEVQGAMRFVANPPIQAWMLDVAAAREAIADVGKIAVTGFCLGGTLKLWRGDQSAGLLGGSRLLRRPHRRDSRSVPESPDDAAFR